MLLYHPLINIIRCICCVIDLVTLPINLDSKTSKSYKGYCGEHRVLDHPRSQDSLPSIHRHLINTDSSWKLSGNCKVKWVCDAISAQQQASGQYRQCRYAEKWCCVHIQLCVCIVCVTKYIPITPQYYSSSKG